VLRGNGCDGGIVAEEPEERFGLERVTARDDEYADRRRRM
jgi:hypothetical protein